MKVSCGSILFLKGLKEILSFGQKLILPKKNTPFLFLVVLYLCTQCLSPCLFPFVRLQKQGYFRNFNLVGFNGIQYNFVSLNLRHAF